MAEAGSNNGTYTDRKSIEDGDIEAGNRSEHVTNRDTKATSSQPLNDQHSYDIGKWASSLSRKLEDVPHYMCRPEHPGRISRIPESLREVNVKSYEPYFLSIGPYHHGRSRVQPMEKSKRLLLRCILENRPELTLQDLLSEVQSIETAARSFYSDLEMDSEKFVRMLLLDSLYIVTAFCGMTNGQENVNQTVAGCQLENERMNQINEIMRFRDDNEDTHMTRSTDELTEEMRAGQDNMTRLYSCLFGHDLFLLENQLPYFVLEKMHAFVYGVSETPLSDIMKEKVRHLLSAYANLNSEVVISPNEKVHHLLHICHLFFRPALQQESYLFPAP